MFNVENTEPWAAASECRGSVRQRWSSGRSAGVGPAPGLPSATAPWTAPAPKQIHTQICTHLCMLKRNHLLRVASVSVHSVTESGHIISAEQALAAWKTARLKENCSKIVLFSCCILPANNWVTTKLKGPCCLGPLVPAVAVACCCQLIAPTCDSTTQ